MIGAWIRVFSYVFKICDIVKSKNQNFWLSTVESESFDFVKECSEFDERYAGKTAFVFSSK